MIKEKLVDVAARIIDKVATSVRSFGCEFFKQAVIALDILYS